MCGICGFNWEDPGIVREMTDVIAHRGPDQHGNYTDSFVSLGHSRLSIIDLSEKGKQPMSNENNDIWVVYNGEIYNFKEIRKDLETKGHIFKSDTDTEIILHAYEEYGTNCVNLFNGMFAFAIWDSKNKKIILARDRVGIKPLFYYFDKLNNKFIFASEIKSIICNPLVKRKFNLSALNQLIDYAYTINGETIIENIHELLPGHLMIYDFNNQDNKLHISKYWEVKNNIQYNSEDFFVKKLGNLLKESVRKRLVADVPLGVSLSGGIDSSSITRFMSDIVDNPIKTFVVGFNDSSDELREAKIVADYCNTDHHEIIVDFKDITKNLAKVLWHAEAPFAKPAMYGTYFLSEGINKNNVIIDLAGEGSDEIFAGYNRYNIYLNNPNNNLSNKEKAEQIVSSYFPNNQEKNNFFNENLRSNTNYSLKPENLFLPNLNDTPKNEHLNAALNFEIKKQLPGVHLLRIDKMSMAHSHEVRVPFQDHELIEFAMTIPSSLKWNGDRKKYILQKTMQNLLPSEIVNRKKLPFHIPLLRYFQEDFIEVAESILSKPSITSITNQLTKKPFIMNQIKKIKSKQLTDDNSLRQILFLTNLELFNQLFLEKDKVTEKDLNINNFL